MTSDFLRGFLNGLGFAGALACVLVIGLLLERWAERLGR